jgi:hypothetical protein
MNLIEAKVKDPVVIRAAAILTTSFVACDVIDHKGYNRLYLDCVIVQGSAMTGIQFQIETSVDGGQTYQLEQQMMVVGGTTNWDDNIHEKLLSADANPRFMIDGIIADKIKVSFKGLTGITGSSLKVTATSSILT